MANKPLPIDPSYRPAVARNEQLRVHRVKQSLTLPAGEIAEITIPSKDGFVTKVHDMMIRVPAKPSANGATSGTHEIGLYYFDGEEEQGEYRFGIIEIESNYDAYLYFSCGEPLGFVGEISKYYPSDLVALHHKLQSIKFGNGVQLGIWYANLTDAEFNPTLEAKFLLVDEQVIN